MVRIRWDVVSKREQRVQAKKGARLNMEGASRPVSLIFKGLHELWANVEIE